MNIWRRRLQELIEKEEQEKAEHSSDASPAVFCPEDNEVIDEARAMLARNPNFGWSWERVLEGVRRIIAHKRGQVAARQKADPPELVEMTPTGCPSCGGRDYWLTTARKRLCLPCNDGKLTLAEVVAVGTVK